MSKLMGVIIGVWLLSCGRPDRNALRRTGRQRCLEWSCGASARRPVGPPVGFAAGCA